MKTSILNGMTVPQLVERFTALALGQVKAELHGETGKYNRLFRELAAIEQELKARNGDQRIALVPLFEHPNAAGQTDGHRTYFGRSESSCVSNAAGNLG